MRFDKSVVSPVMVGRVQDLEILERQVEQITIGRGQVTLVAGEAGLGKSRLIAEIIRRAELREIPTLQGNCFETDRVLPYAPFLDLLHTYCATHSADTVAHTLAPVASELCKIFPELHSYFSDLIAAPAPEPEQEKRRLFQTLAEWLRPQAGRGLLAVIEDLHWCDDTSLEFLLFFARHFATLPILLLLTYRSDHVTPALNHFLAELDRAHLATEITLTPLAPNQVAEMLRAIFDLKRPVRAEFVQVLYRLTEGNPFFIEEVLKALITTGEIYYEEGEWDRKPIHQLHIPRTVQDAVRQRSAQLNADAQQVLAFAAVAGRRFDFALLQRLLGMSETELLPLVKQLLAAQLVVEESADEFSFRHALTREAVYVALLHRERRMMHARVGEALEALYPKEGDGYAGDLAHHFHAAQAWDRALHYARRAGEQAQRMYAPREAIAHFTNALEAAQELNSIDAYDLLRARGSAFHTAGDFERARADYEAALDAARAQNKPAQEWQALLDLGLLWAGRDYVKTGEYYQRAHDLARATHDAPMLARSLNRLGNWCANVDRPADALAYHQEALELCQSDREGMAETFDLLGMANYIHGDLVTSAAFYEQAIELERELGDRNALVSSLACSVMHSGFLPSDVAVMAHKPRADVLRAGEEALSIARAIGQRSGEAYALCILGGYLRTQGEYAQALTYAQSGLTLAQEIEHAQWTTLAFCTLGALALDLFDLKTARVQLENALQLARALHSKWWLHNTTRFLAETFILQNEFERAQRLLDAAQPELERGTLAARGCWFGYAELAFARGDFEHAGQICEDLIASAAHVTDGGIIPRIWLLRGQILHAQQRFDQAQEILTAARDTALAQGARPLLWHIDAALGKLYQRTAQREGARRVFDAARADLDELAAEIPDAGVRERFLHHALGILPPTHAPSAGQIAKTEYGGLTARERQVATLIAQGKSNREIADALVVSERTIETHVGNILTKLDLRSRAQIAMWAVEKGLTKA